ncbi:MAG: glycosyltransferase [Promethearchaeati archaeon SRVP18_Atabeyarchaeia-1]
MDNGLRILAISDDSIRAAGGRLTFIRLCRKLRERNDKILLVMNTGKTEEILGRRSNELRIKVPQTTGYIRYPLFSLKLLPLMIKVSKSFDVILVNAGPITFPVLVMAKLLGKKVVEFHHDVPETVGLFLSYAPSLRKKVSTLLRIFANYSILKYFDGILSVSGYTSALLKRFKVKRVFTVGNILD